MFEKEAEEYGTSSKVDYINNIAITLVQQAYKDGAEFGYNKANEWHYVKDGDLPKEENHYWSKIVLFQTNKGDSYVGFFDHANKVWYEKSTDDIVYGVIAWKEIVLPELKEIKEND